MRWISLTSLWTLIGVTAFFLASAGLTEAEPSDDFSFSLGNSPKAGVYHFMPENRISEVLSDRLDLFPRSQAPRLARHILSLCKYYRFNPAYILSLIEVESSYRIKATSPCGAIGLMQLMLPTAQFVVQNLGYRFSGYENFHGKSLRKRILTSRMLMDPYVNIAIGLAYLASLRDHYRDLSPYHVFAAYNIGPARMDELLTQKSFQPTETGKYFLSIRKRIPYLRSYQKASHFSVRRAPSLRHKFPRI